MASELIALGLSQEEVDDHIKRYRSEKVTVGTSLQSRRKSKHEALAEALARQEFGFDDPWAAAGELLFGPSSETSTNKEMS